MMRLNKYLASSGLASRRGAEDFIRAGRVRVNGAVVSDLGRSVSDTDIVELDGSVVARQPEKVYIMMNKPRGVVTSCRDQFSRRTVIDVLNQGTGRGAKSIGPTRVYPVGRLDYDSDGLLLLTNDGDFAKSVTHPSGGVTKTYAARLNRAVSGEELKKLCEGVKIKVAGNAGPKTVTVRAKSVRTTSDNNVEVVISEGKNRQVRKMFEALGVRVVRLTRTAIGGLRLGNLKPGEWKTIKKPNL
jgi:23S rRNA pseudouridine2605 synthase